MKTLNFMKIRELLIQKIMKQQVHLWVKTRSILRFHSCRKLVEQYSNLNGDEFEQFLASNQYCR